MEDFMKKQLLIGAVIVATLCTTACGKIPELKNKEQVAEMIEKGEGSVEVLSSDDKWFGMTYPEDKPMVMSSLRAKIESGYYPEKLWEN